MPQGMRVRVSPRAPNATPNQPDTHRGSGFFVFIARSQPCPRTATFANARNSTSENSRNSASTSRSPKEELSDAIAEVLVADFFSEVVEPRKLMYGGWLTFGYICRDSRGDASEEDRAAVRAWLEKRPEIAAVKVGELVDAWR